MLRPERLSRLVILVERDREAELLDALVEFQVHALPSGVREEPALSRLEEIASSAEVGPNEMEEALRLVSIASGGERSGHYYALESVIREYRQILNLEKYAALLERAGINLEARRRSRFLYVIVAVAPSEKSSQAADELRRIGAYVIRVPAGGETLLVIVGARGGEEAVVEALRKLRLPTVDVPPLEELERRREVLLKEFKRVLVEFIAAARKGAPSTAPLMSRYFQLRSRLERLRDSCADILGRCPLTTGSLGERKCTSEGIELELESIEKAVADLESRVAALKADFEFVEGLEKRLRSLAESGGLSAFKVEMQKLRKVVESVGKVESLDELKKAVREDLEEACAEVARLLARLELVGRCVRLLAVAGNLFRRIVLLRRYEYSMLEGYVPAKQAEMLVNYIRKRVPVLYVGLEDVAPEESPPYLPAFRGVWRYLTSLTLTLGVPRYAEVDPTIILSLLFASMYGLMFGDIGLGLLISAFGLIVGRKPSILSRPLGLREESVKALSLLMVLCGLSSTIVGVVYGTAFLVRVLPPTIAPIEDTEKIIAVALIYGVVQMILGISLNVINCLLEKEWTEAFIGSRGITGLLFYLTGLALAYKLLENGFDFSAIMSRDPLLVYLLALFYACVVASPLLRAIKGHEPLSTCAVEGAAEGLEVIVGFSANTLSYLRLAAFAIAHEIFGVVAGQLGQSIGYLPALVITNLMVLVFEGFAVGIQAVRLTFYEFAMKFFRGDGTLFTGLSRLIYPGKAVEKAAATLVSAESIRA